MKNTKYWKQKDKSYNKKFNSIVIPNGNLAKVDYVEFKNINDFEKLPKANGCYWIWTNAPVKHRLHKNKTPKLIEKIFKGKKHIGQIIYNGVSDNIKDRIQRHLLSNGNPSWSAISVDVLFSEVVSHRKKAMATNKEKKVPYVLFKNKLLKIINKKLLLRIWLTKKEKTFICRSSKTQYFFKNGINVFDKKHTKRIYRAYFITGISQTYRDYIEKMWRERYGQPVLCSYKKGR